MTESSEKSCLDRLKSLEVALAKLQVIEDDDMQILVDLAKKERDRRVVDAWLASVAAKVVSKGSYVITLAGVVWFFWDHLIGFLEFVIENRRSE